MKTLTYGLRAARDLRKMKGHEAEHIASALLAYAKTGKADIEPVAGTTGRRMRVGQRRILFVETTREITVLAIVSRGQAYSKKALRAFGKRR